MDKENSLEIPPMWSAGQVKALIPSDWLGATIVIMTDSINKPCAIKRVALVTNHDGSKVVILGSENQHVFR